MASSYATALAAAKDAAGGQTFASGTLFIVATPIGNLADVSLRALHVLSIADRIACEDTRHTQALLRAYGIERPLMALHEHNERDAAARVIEVLVRGERVVYVSDAGTPGISDPGGRLVADVMAAGLRVCPIPGASSIAAAISVAGLGDAASGFVFRGFLPARGPTRQSALAELVGEQRAQVLLESPHRIEALASELAPMGERMLTIARELTKQHEQIAMLPAEAFAGWLAASPDHRRGEFAVIIHPTPLLKRDETESERVLTLLLKELPLKTAVRLTADITGHGRNSLYALALQLRGHAPGPDQC